MKRSDEEMKKRLEELEASVLSEEPTVKSAGAREKEDASEAAFRNQIADLLGAVSSPSSKAETEKEPESTGAEAYREPEQLSIAELFPPEEKSAKPAPQAESVVVQTENSRTEKPIKKAVKTSEAAKTPEEREILSPSVKEFSAAEENTAVADEKAESPAKAKKTASVPETKAKGYVRKAGTNPRDRMKKASPPPKKETAEEPAVQKVEAVAVSASAEKPKKAAAPAPRTAEPDKKKQETIVIQPRRERAGVVVSAPISRVKKETPNPPANLPDQSGNDTRLPKESPVAPQKEKSKSSQTVTEKKQAEPTPEKERTVRQTSPKEQPKTIPAFSGKFESAASGNSPKRRTDKWRKNKAAEPESPLSVIAEKSGLNASDVDLIFELGYENELAKMVGLDCMRQLKAERIRADRDHSGIIPPTAFGYRRREYTGSAADTFLKQYAHDRSGLLPRLALTALLFLMLFVLDFPHLFDPVFTPYTERFPWLFPLLGALLLLTAALLSAKALLTGLKSFFNFSPTLYSVNALLFPLSIAYDIFSVFSPSHFPVNLLTCSSLLLTSVCDFLRLESEIRVLRLISYPAPKTVLETAEHRKKKLTFGKSGVKIVNENPDEKIYRVRPVSGVSGFFRRCNNYSSSYRTFSRFLCFMLAVPLVLGFFKILTGADAFTVFSVTIAAVMVSAPTAAILFTVFPLTYANRILTSFGCAIVGDESVEEYSTEKALLFSGADLFSVQKCNRLMAPADEKAKLYNELAAALFRKISGIPTMMLGEREKNDHTVSLCKVAENGVDAILDGTYRVLAGNGIYLRRCGIKIPPETTDRVARRPVNVSLIYVAVDGKLCLSYEFTYREDRDFCETLQYLLRSNCRILLQSYDPSLGSGFLQAMQERIPSGIRMMKSGNHGFDEVAEVADSGIVALRKKSDITYPLDAVLKIKKVRSFGSWLLRLTGIAGVLLVGFLPLDIFSDKISLGILGIRIVTCLLTVIAAWLTLRGLKPEVRQKRIQKNLKKAKKRKMPEQPENN